MTDRQKQHLLGYLGYYSGQVDGIWGGKSEEATRAFQRDYGLEVDGVFGAATEKRILEAVVSGKKTSGTFWDGIRHFTRGEFRCPCASCGGFPAEPAEKLVHLAEQVREHFGSPADISSGVRCPRHNAEVGGVWNSLHLTGRAMDFRVRGKPASEVLSYVKTLPVHYAYAIDESYVHMDIE